MSRTRGSLGVKESVPFRIPGCPLLVSFTRMSCICHVRIAQYVDSSDTPHQRLALVSLFFWMKPDPRNW